MRARVLHRRGLEQQRVRVDHLVVLIDAEVQMRRRVLRVAGVADVSEEITGLHFHPFVEAGGPAIEMRVVERRAVFRGQPEAMSALRLIADVADDAVDDGDDLGALRREDVDAFVQARAAVARIVPAVAEVAIAHADHRHAQRGGRQRGEERRSAVGELFVALLRARRARRDGRLARHFAAIVTVQIGAKLRDDLAPVVVIGGERDNRRRLRFGRTIEGE